MFFLMEPPLVPKYRAFNSIFSFFLFLSFSSVLLALIPLAESGDAEALLTLKASIDPMNSLPWRGSIEVCDWKGVKECSGAGRVMKLVLEFLNLNGTLDEKSLNQLDQLRVLSLKGNSISGQIPDLSGIRNLKSLYLSNNRFSGGFPSSVSGLHRLKVVVLAGNRISGKIPATLLMLRRLYDLDLEGNRLTGGIPPLNQTSLRFLNVSNNELSGEIPATPALRRFNRSSFSNNPGLCGAQIQSPCARGSSSNNGGSVTTPPLAIAPTSSRSGSSSHKRTKLIKIIAGSVGGSVLLLICLVLAWFACKNGGGDGGGRRTRKKAEAAAREGGVAAAGESSGTGGKNGANQGGFSWEGAGGGDEGLGRLVFCGAGDPHRSTTMSYSVEDLLRASAETLGRGSVGSTYKAVMESGYIVTVKRLKDAGYPRAEDEFLSHVEALGRLTHPNLVPLRAYFHAKEERLLVYDYFPNGSLFSLIHGSRVPASGKPLHWTSCLKIAEDLASGLLYVHQNPGFTHGNIKSSNVLLGPDFESCLTDYGLTPLRNPDSLEEPSATTFFYRAPECRDTHKLLTKEADVYSFGVLLLELLTGKTPFQDLVQEHREDIPRWVRSVREEESNSGEDHSSGNEASEEKLTALLNIAIACVSLVPESRPGMREVLKMIREVRAEAQVSSNSSDHSPGRWSDTVLSLPRKEQLSI